ncbi:hypothetical protein [Brevibacillus sp. SYSU BS000544]|uniref:hypothetical protein n=1 Tax=Brevibacillus sp. SYSU BS000544 TaxID=3416443 RepID=UPI003CE541A0
MSEITIDYAGRNGSATRNQNGCPLHGSRFDLRVGLQVNKKTVLPESGELLYFPSLVIGAMKLTNTVERYTGSVEVVGSNICFVFNT